MNTKLALAVGLLAALPTLEAAPVLGGSVIVEDPGDVVATFIGHTAGFSNDLYLYLPANAHGIIFNNHSTLPGTTFNLGSFPVGTELIFGIHVNDTGEDYFTGPASRNPDGLPHAVVDGSFNLAGDTYVGFEDIFGGGDLDYDDLQFSFSNTRAVGTPDAGSAGALLVFALGGLAFMRRRLSH